MLTRDRSYTLSRAQSMLLEQLRYNLLFRWFVGLGMDDPIWDVSSFSKNRQRFLDGEISKKFFAAVVTMARGADLLSDEHFTVDGTLIEAWASQKSFKPKDEGGPRGSGRNADVDFRGKPRSNDTHVSTTDPDARLYRKSQGAPAVLGYLGHALMENRNGLIVGTRVTHASGTAERDAALQMLKDRHTPGITVGADKGYDTAAFVAPVSIRSVRPEGNAICTTFAPPAPSPAGRSMCAAVAIVTGRNRAADAGAPGLDLADACDSRFPDRYRACHWYRLLRFTPCSRAIARIDAPGCSVSSTMRRFSAIGNRRRGQLCFALAPAMKTSRRIKRFFYHREDRLRGQDGTQTTLTYKTRR